MDKENDSFCYLINIKPLAVALITSAIMSGVIIGFLTKIALRMSINIDCTRKIELVFVSLCSITGHSKNSIFSTFNRSFTKNYYRPEISLPFEFEIEYYLLHTSSDSFDITSTAIFSSIFLFQNMDIVTPEQFTQLKNGHFSGYLNYSIKSSVHEELFAEVKEFARGNLIPDAETIVFEGKSNNYIKLNLKEKSVEARIYKREFGLNRFEYLPTDFKCYHVVIGAINETDLCVITKLPAYANVTIKTTDTPDPELLDRINEVAKLFTGAFNVECS